MAEKHTGPLSDFSFETLSLQIRHLGTITPTSPSRTWQSRPHPTLPLIATACADKSVRLSSLTSLKGTSCISGGHKRSIRTVAWKPGSGPVGVTRRIPKLYHSSKSSAEHHSTSSVTTTADDETEHEADHTEIKGTGQSVLCTGSFDASAGIWRRWETTSQHMSSSSTTPDDEDTEVEEDGDAEDKEEWSFAVVLDGHESEIKSASYCPTAPYLATCSRDKSVWIWEELEDDNYETVAVLQEHEGDVKCLAWHPEEIMVASGSYDDTVRLWKEEVEGEGEWACAALLEGFGGTVWWLEFEPAGIVGWIRDGNGDSDREEAEKRKQAGARLVIASDDLTIRIWRRIPKEKNNTQQQGQRLPSILRTNSIAEEWIEEAKLPPAHERAIYAVNWSPYTGRIVSCGSDGRIIIYEERWRDAANKAVDTNNTSKTEWVVVGQMHDAHGVAEINHVTWAIRADKGKQYGNEEVIVSTGDDGEVEIWTVTRD